VADRPLRWRACGPPRGCGRAGEPVAGEGFAQRRPGGTQLGRGGVDAAQLLGELEGAFGFGSVSEEPAGLPAQRRTLNFAGRELLEMMRPTCGQAHTGAVLQTEAIHELGRGWQDRT
jgi:hypothetical protein